MTSVNEKFTEFFGANLIRCDADKKFEKVPTLDALKDKKGVLVYFSAHWCPPCRGFTPKLAEWYKNTAQKQGLEVVFFSSDRDQAAFDEYCAEMPWLAVPYDERELKTKASSRLEVQGIPMLVALDSQGNIVTKEGRKFVTTEPEGFPWKTPKLTDMLTPDTEFVSNDGSKKTLADLSGKTLGFYFSAHWCPPCRGFTPILTDVYKKVKEAGNDFEIVFCSSDQDEGAFKEYFGEMPWLALPYEKRELKEQLSQYFEVEGIPTFAVLDKDLKVITTEATSPIRSSPETAHTEFPWVAKPVNEIDTNPSGIDEAPALVILQDKLPEDKRKANTALITEIAETASKASDSTDGDAVENVFVAPPAKPFKFFLSSEEGPLGGRVRSECKVPDDDKLHVVLLNIPEQGAYYNWDDAKDLTGDNVNKFLDDYKAGKLEKKQMGA